MSLLDTGKVLDRFTCTQTITLPRIVYNMQTKLFKNSLFWASAGCDVMPVSLPSHCSNLAVAARWSADPHHSHVALAEHRHNISFNSTACLPGPSIPHLALGSYQGFILGHDAGVLYRLNNVLAAASNLGKACCAQISPNLIGTYCIIVMTIYILQMM